MRWSPSLAPGALALMALPGVVQLVLAGNAFAQEVADDGASDPVEVVPGIVHGELTWGNGNRYVGGLKAGKMHGRGTHTTSAGAAYDGDFHEGMRAGYGTLRFPNGDVYAGDFRNNEMTGTGRLTWANGDLYEGDFVDGVRQGRGVLKRQTGGTYVGAFSADQRHGLGHYRWRDGTLYKGNFAFGRQHGAGVKRSPDGELSFEEWNDGQLMSAVTVEAVERCTLVIDDKLWMFNDNDCINGLAHGEGLAVALDATAYILNGRFILGKTVRGVVRSLEIEPP